MTTTFDPFLIAIELILSPSIEGGYSNDPQDPGGETNWGISKRAYPNLDIKNLTREQAVEIYRQDYWNRYGLARLPVGIAIATFDGAVNHGARAAIKMLQHAVAVPMDGVIGGQTLAACFRADQTTLLTDYCARRAVYYTNIGTFARFGIGWMRRLFTVHTVCRDIKSKPNE